MKKRYCERGHIVLGDTCSQCAWRANTAAGEAIKPAAVPALNGTLVELRNLKSMLQKRLITEAEYDERRNYILANF